MDKPARPDIAALDVAHAVLDDGVRPCQPNEDEMSACNCGLMEFSREDSRMADALHALYRAWPAISSYIAELERRLEGEWTEPEIAVLAAELQDAHRRREFWTDAARAAIAAMRRR